MSRTINNTMTEAAEKEILTKAEKKEQFISKRDLSTAIRPFSTVALTQTSDSGRLEEIVDYRQISFQKTEKYLEARNKLHDIINKLNESGISKDLLDDLDDCIIMTECIHYSDAYRAGMVDLMTAMTFNKSEITEVEYLA